MDYPRQAAYIVMSNMHGYDHAPAALTLAYRYYMGQRYYIGQSCKTGHVGTLVVQTWWVLLGEMHSRIEDVLRNGSHHTSFGV